jgi:outer membrane lipoprotein-sorting protein
MKLICFLLLFFSCTNIFSQGEEALLKAVRDRLQKVKDYQANGTMTVDVPFINAQPASVKVYYKQPEFFKVVKDGGVSILPKGGVSVNLNALLVSDRYTVVPSGKAVVKNSSAKVIKLLPLDEKSDIVIATLYIDEIAKVIRKALVTTKENGSYELEMDYGKYLEWGLPDRMVFIFSLKDYKLPKGVTFEYEKGEKKKAPPDPNKPGRIILLYKTYSINKGIAASVFK